MKHRLAFLPLLLSAFLARAEHPLIYTSPARCADEVADAAFAVADGDGGTSAIQPVQEQAKPVGADLRADRVIDRSTLIRTLVGFPQDFLDGLVAEERHGHVSFPISVRIDPVSGCALFENAAGRVFYAIAPVAGNAAASAIPAENVVVKWRVLPQEGIQSRNPEIPKFRFSGLRTTDPDVLRLSSIECATNGVTIGATWPASDAPTNGVLDVYFSTHLDRDWRVVKTMTIPSGATNLTTFLAIADIPSYTNLPPAHVHDADCHIVTNIAPNIFSGGAAVTNIHWSCAGQRIPPYKGDSGFFRLGTRQDSDGDGLPDAYEIIVLGSNPLLSDSDGDGLSDAEEGALGTNPLSADSDGDHLPDLWEVWNDTNPLDSTDGLSDADGDGLPFWTEVLELLTDPDLADTDGDGLSDSWEEEHLTDPNDRDSDWDGLTDGMEVAIGTNPLFADSDGDGLYDAWEWSVDGFAPLDSIDAEADWDGDGISNGDEAHAGHHKQRNNLQQSSLRYSR